MVRFKSHSEAHLNYQAAEGGTATAALLERVQKAEERAEKAEINAIEKQGSAGGTNTALVERLQRELDFAYKQKSTLEAKYQAMEANLKDAQERTTIAEATSEELAQARAESEVEIPT